MSSALGLIRAAGWTGRHIDRRERDSQAGYTAREDVIWARAETAEAISFGRRYIATMRKEDHREGGCRKPREVSRAQ
jgi:hypothetical protein